MKSLPWILVCLLLGVIVWMAFRPHEPLPAEVKTETKIKTVVKVGTLSISPPMAPLLIFRLKDTMHIGETVVQREQAYYEDSLYRAWVSGYRPRLDSLRIFPRTVCRLDMLIQMVGMLELELVVTYSCGKERRLKNDTLIDARH